MQRGSSKVGRLEDEQRRHETSGFVQGAPVEERDDVRRQESPGDGEPDMEPGRRPRTADPSGGERSPDEAADLADFARWMRPSWFPLAGDELTARVRGLGAPRWIVERLSTLDDAGVVSSPTDAWERTGR